MRQSKRNKSTPRIGNNRVKRTGAMYRAGRRARAKVAMASKRRNRA
jgi:hypothetical protein